MAETPENGNDGPHAGVEGAQGSHAHPSLTGDFKRRWMKAIAPEQGTAAGDITNEPVIAQGLQTGRSSSEPEVKELVEEKGEERNIESIEGSEAHSQSYLAEPAQAVQPAQLDAEKIGLTNGSHSLQAKGIRNLLANGEAVGKTNGKTNGDTNGRVNGKANGRTRVRALPRKMMLARGLINGNGWINGLRRGLSNGSGLVDGNGLINGNGYVNGASLVNGKKLLYGEKLARPIRPRRAAVYGIVALIVAVLAIGPYFAIMGDLGIAIDGEFSDWEGAQRFSDSSADMSANPDVNIEGTSIAYDDDSISFLVEVRGRMFDGDMKDGKRGLGIDTAQIFIDTDRTPSTGYDIMGLGTDARIEVVGWSNSVKSASLYKFDGARENDDWNGFSCCGPLPAMSSGDKFETQVAYGALGIPKYHKVDMTVVMMDADRNVDALDYPASSSGSVLQAAQKWTAPSTCAPGMSYDAVDVELYSKYGNVKVTSLTFTKRGTADDSSFGTAVLEMRDTSSRELPNDVILSSARVSDGTIVFDFDALSITENSVVRLIARIPIMEGARAGSTFAFALDDSNAVGRENGKGSVAISPLVGSSYISSSPAGIVVDGKFDDWLGVRANYDGDADVSGDHLGTSEKEQREVDNIDVRDYRITTYGSDLFAYVRVDGNALGGSEIPVIMASSRSFYETTYIGGNPSPGGTEGEPKPLPELIGKDFVYVLVDVDKNENTGMSLDASHKGFDSAIVVEGTRGRVQAAKVVRFDDTSGMWANDSAYVRAACDGSEIELGAALSALGITDQIGEFNALIYMTNWKNDLDISDDVLECNHSRYEGRAGTNVVLNEICPKPLGAQDWIELYNPTTGTIDISGWKIDIYDSRGVLTYTYTVPQSTSLSAGQYYIAYVPIAISEKGGRVVLRSGAGQVDSVNFPKLSATDRSYSRHYGDWDLNDDSAWFISRDSTPGAPNEAVPEFGNIFSAIMLVCAISLAVTSRKRRNMHVKGRLASMQKKIGKESGKGVGNGGE